MGVVGLRSRATGVARPRNVRTTTDGKAPQFEAWECDLSRHARENGPRPSNAGRAGAQPYHAHTPIRFSCRPP
jgi:hypothetical protein